MVVEVKAPRNKITGVDCPVREQGGVEADDAGVDEEWTKHLGDGGIVVGHLKIGIKIINCNSYNFYISKTDIFTYMPYVPGLSITLFRPTVPQKAL